MSKAQGRQGPGSSPVAVERSAYRESGILIAPSPADIERVERRVEKVISQLAVANISDIDGPEEVVVRDLLPTEDLESGSDNSALENTWVQDTLTADQFNETYNIDHSNLAEDKIIAILAISNVSASPATTEIRVDNAQGGVFEILQVEGLLTDDEVLGLLNDPIISATSQENMDINQYVTQTADQVVFHGKVAEERGTTMSQTNTLLSEKGPQAGGRGR